MYYFMYNMGMFAVGMMEKHDLLCFHGYRDCARNFLRRYSVDFDLDLTILLV